MEALLADERYLPRHRQPETPSERSSEGESLSAGAERRPLAERRRDLQRRRRELEADDLALAGGGRPRRQQSPAPASDPRWRSSYTGQDELAERAAAELRLPRAPTLA